MNDNFETSLKAWNENEKAANELINIVGKLWYDKSVELILLRSLLVNRGSGKILNKHLRAENVLHKPVRVQDSLLIAKALLAENLAPARIDLGRLNSEWTDEKEKYNNDVTAFVRDKLHYIINAVPRSNKVQDVILYGFGRIGRILCREMTEMAGRGDALRVRAIVTRKNSPEDILKRINLFRTDSVLLLPRRVLPADRRERHDGQRTEDSLPRSQEPRGPRLHAIWHQRCAAYRQHGCLP